MHFFWTSDARKPCQGKSHLRYYVVEKGILAEHGMHVTAWKEVTRLLKGFCRREGKVED